MLQKLPNTLLGVLLSLFLTSSYAATISFSGETQVCPGMDYTYTASASDVFGSRKGHFEWTFWRGNTKIHSIGYPIAACPGGGASSSTVTFNWGTELGARRIEIRFKGMNTPLCDYVQPDFKSVNVNIRVISPGPISGLVFCSPNETRTVSVPGVLPFNSPVSCYFHYKYDWIVPTGWTVTPNNNVGYEVIPGGIRTFATSVSLKAPANVIPGINGNYNITVKSEPSWPYPVQSTGRIWVGPPMLNGLTCQDCGGPLPGSGCQGSTNIYESSLNPNYPANAPYTFGWSGINAEVVSNGANTAWATYNGSIGSYASVSATVTGLCGQDGSYTWMGEIVYCGGGGTTTFVAYPNPSNDDLTISSGDLEIKSKGGKYQVTIVNEQNKVMYQNESQQGQDIKVSVKDWKPGIYFIKMIDGANVKQARLKVEH